MSSKLVYIEVPPNLAGFKLPKSVQQRLQHLLDRQDQGFELTVEERREAEELVDLAEWMTLLKLRATPTKPKSTLRK